MKRVIGSWTTRAIIRLLALAFIVGASLATSPAPTARSAPPTPGPLWPRSEPPLPANQPRPPGDDLPATPLGVLWSQGPAPVVGLQYGTYMSGIDYTDAYSQGTPHYGLVRDMGFQWVKLYTSWATAQPSADQPPDFSGLDRVVDLALANGLRVLVLVENAPIWATGSTSYGAPPIDDLALGEYMGRLAAHFQGRVSAYEVWNEPNTWWGWGEREPDPARYVRMLRGAYAKVKAADPDALVITGGLSNTGDARPGSGNWGDLVYIEAMKAAGADGYFDALGVHPYGGPYPPEVGHEAAPMGTFFRRAEEEHAVAVRAFGREVPIWVTEAGWLVDPAVDGRPNCLDDHFRQMTVPSEAVQGDYLTRAYRYAREHWPWVGLIAFFTLDLNAEPWRRDHLCDPALYYGLLRPDGSLRPAYQSLKALPKHVVQVSFQSPAYRSQVSGLVTVSGAALDPDALTGTGVTGVAVYLDGSPGLGALVGDAAYRLASPSAARPNAGFGLQWDTRRVSAGRHRLFAAARADDGSTHYASTEVTVSPALDASPRQVDVRLAPDGPTTAALAVRVVRTDGQAPSAWRVTSGAGPAWLSLATTSGSGTTPLRLAIDRTGLPVGWYSTELTVIADDTDLPNDCRAVAVPVRLFVGRTSYFPIMPGARYRLKTVSGDRPNPPSPPSPRGKGEARRRRRSRFHRRRWRPEGW